MRGREGGEEEGGEEEGGGACKVRGRTGACRWKHDQGIGGRGSLRRRPVDSYAPGMPPRMTAG